MLRPLGAATRTGLKPSKEDELRSRDDLARRPGDPYRRGRVGGLCRLGAPDHLVRCRVVGHGADGMTPLFRRVLCAAAGPVLGGNLTTRPSARGAGGPPGQRLAL